MNRENSPFLGDSASPESILTGRPVVGLGIELCTHKKRNSIRKFTHVGERMTEDSRVALVI